MNKEKYDEAEEIINKIMIDDYSTESQKKNMLQIVGVQ